MSRKRPPACWLYAFDGGTHGVKVGVAGAFGLMSRLGAHQRQCLSAAPFAKTWHAPLIARDVEAYVKAMMYDQRVCGTEWFGVPIEELLDTVEFALNTYRRLAAAHAKAVQEGRGEWSMQVHVLCGGSPTAEWLRPCKSQELRASRQAAQA